MGKGLLKQNKSYTNKPNFLINIVRNGTPTSFILFNHFYKIVLSEFDFNNSNTSQSNIFYTTMSDIKKSLGLDVEDKNHTFIYNSIDIMMQTSIELIQTYNKIDKISQEEYQTWSKRGKFNIISAFSEVNDKKGTFAFEIPNLLLEHLKKLKEQRNLIYTKLFDSCITQFKLGHSIPLYEKLKEHQKLTKMKISLEDLREYLNLKDKYKKPIDFKRYVIEKTLEEILNISDLKFTYKIEKLLDTKSKK